MNTLKIIGYVGGIITLWVSLCVIGYKAGQRKDWWLLAAGLGVMIAETLIWNIKF